MLINVLFNILKFHEKKNRRKQAFAFPCGTKCIQHDLNAVGLVFYIVLHKNSCFTRNVTHCNSSPFFIARNFVTGTKQNAKAAHDRLFWVQSFSATSCTTFSSTRNLLKSFFLRLSRQKQFTSTASITSSSPSVSGTNFAKLLSRCEIFQVAHFVQKQKLFYSGFDCGCSRGEKGSLMSLGIWRLRLWARQRAFKRSVPVSRFQPITD